ncbi:alpha/beta fold hydrolase [Marinitenerispora sediminis]|uniref:Alpha/beta hydrolase n=1 Tax=Marinitenerispora sediminis TaxID=1931232 RepID=A0A368TB33_9ACTN|nr:alpha/beta hydrolase [Marinitenerispora sediminis]RCV53650.1 alpha/beta hydrolase [Marinitenerispora sediminis]RCV57366.1 alpha/beta hydrolase [Marinitenerispora sediminis]RCV62354.1 alpha/beta hydrolase [Marinitenerispora sediminis]
MRDESAVMVDGPWTHRTVSAAGTRFHLVEAGDGPLVLLLHGFPQFWWSWHRQLTPLAEAGYRAVAVDLRGYGASDKPPRGYDLVTLAADAAGLVRALGEAEAVVVGHSTGAMLGWTMGRYFPKMVRRLAVLSMPHPLRLRAGMLSLGQGWSSRHFFGYQLPMLPERRLLADDAALVGRMLRGWSRPGWPDAATERRFRDAFQIPGVAHCSLEYYRWLFRSQVRPDGQRYMARMRRPATVPTLQMHGSADPVLLPMTARGSGRYVEAPYRWRLIEGAGHFPHLERPERVNALLTGWLGDTEPDA